MDVAEIRKLPPAALAAYFREALKNDPTAEYTISTSIFAAVERESLPPVTVSVWLSIARSPEVLRQALTQEFSVSIRKFGIIRFFKSLRKKQWKQSWEGLGGTAGIVTFLSHLSVSEVNLCLRQFSRWQNGPDRAEKQANVTAILQRLIPSNFSDPNLSRLDGQPFDKGYQLMLLPGCSPPFVERVLREGGPLLNEKFQVRPSSALLREQCEVLRKQCLDAIFSSKAWAFKGDVYLDRLLHRSPDFPSDKPRFSESMAFSLHILQRLVSQPPSHSKLPIQTLRKMIESLLSRMRKRRASFLSTKEVVELCLKYISSDPYDEKVVIFSPFCRNRFVYTCIWLWVSSNQALECEALLIRSLQLCSYAESRNLRDYSSALETVPKHIRYRLLELLFFHLGNASVNIGDPESLKLGEIKTWPLSIFFALPSAEAVQLLVRLQKASLGRDFLETGQGILSQTPNIDILLNLLQQDQPEMLDRAITAVEEAKRMSEKSRDQVDRASHARSAIVYAISSGSVDLYGETLLWAKRFVRDPLTVKTVFATSLISTTQSIDLLSGLPRDSKSMAVSRIALNLSSSNRVIFELFETAVSALKEPSFYKPDWQAPLDIIRDVIFERLTRSTSVQECLQLSDSQLYDLVWKDTLDLALRIEKLGLEPGYEKLEFRGSNIFLKYDRWRLLRQQHPQSPSSFRFIDELAQGRDGLWRSFRLSTHPATAVLPPLFPRGLPIQTLVSGFEVAIETASTFMPFIFSRAESLVFAHKENALTPIPQDEDIRSAVGSFVDSFTFALKIYVFQGSTTTIQARTLKAWEHVLENFSERMTSEEALRMWRNIFAETVPSFKPPSLLLPETAWNQAWPNFPFDAENGEYMEWNPLEDMPRIPEVERRLLSPLTSLDMSLASTPTCIQPTNRFVPIQLSTQGIQPLITSIWDMERLNYAEYRIPAVREGLIVSALLHLEQYIPNQKSVLAKPFPSQEDTRYPDMWLDLAFVESSLVSNGPQLGPYYAALEPLRFFLSEVPPSLLQRLTAAAFDSLFQLSGDKDSKIVALEELGFNLLSLLADSDRPSLAMEMIIKVVIERPDSSSWHRILLSKDLLQRLSASQAREMIQSFADCIRKQLEKTAKQPKKELGSLSTNQTPASPAYIKISTIKYLAQLLRRASFVPESFAIEILGSLLQTAAHIDVQVAAVESLVSMLVGCQEDPSNGVADKIFECLEMAIPISGRLDERYLISDADWKDAKETGKLPEVFQEGTTAFDLCLPPIISILTTISSEKWQERILSQILIPVLEFSTKVNTQWLEIFTAKHGVDFQSLDLPQLPVKPKFLKDLLSQNLRYVSAPLLQLYHSFIMTAVSPPPALVELNAKLRELEIVNTSEVKHWLSLYGHGPDIDDYDDFDISSLLQGTKQRPISKNTVAQLQTHQFEHATALIQNNLRTATYNFMKSFDPGLFPSATELLNPLNDARLPLERIIAHIDAIRSPEWQQDSNRQPNFLPSTWEYRLWLLPYPPPNASKLQISSFVNALRGLIEELCEPNGLYLTELHETGRQTNRVLPEFRAQIACLLGELREILSQADFFCIDVAGVMFRGAYLPSPQDNSIIDESKRVVQSWTNSSNEWVRNQGFDMERLMDSGAFPLKVKKT